MHIKLHESDRYSLLFSVNDIIYYIEANENEDLFKTICNDLDAMIEGFEDCWNSSSEEHYTRDYKIPLTPELLPEYPEFINEWIEDHESRWKIVTE
jgi:hypothetical protein